MAMRSQPDPYTNAAGLKRTLKRLIKALLDANPAPPGTSARGLARTWLSGSTGSQPVAVNAWMRRALTDDALGSQVVTLTPANAIAYAAKLDGMVDDFIQGAQPSDPSLASAWTWLKAEVSQPGDTDIPPDVLEFVDDSLPSV